MNIERIVKPAFTVIGKEGGTLEGEGFIQRLWAEANAHFHEVAPLAKTDEHGQLAGVWGAMTDLSRTFALWEDDFSRGLYLAGVECRDDAEAPDGWTKWVVPGGTFLRARQEEDLFPRMLRHIADSGLTLAGAVHDFTDPATGTSYMVFPVRQG